MPEVGKLELLKPDYISPNPDNPRLIFKEKEMDDLQKSIEKDGIKVPITVYEEERDKYILLDGERRWQCSRKLGLDKIPAIIQPKPKKIENILTMFSIHKLRVDWELMPTAIKLNELKELLEQEEGEISNEKLATLTGVSKTTVERALELVALPQKYQNMLMEEAEKPKEEQRIKPDVFIEAQSSIRSVSKFAPEVFKQVTKKQFLQSMVDKYLDRVITNVINFRDIKRISNSSKAGVTKEVTVPILVRLVKNKNYSIDQAYEDTVKAAYERRDMLTQINDMSEKLFMFETPLDTTTIAALEQLRAEVNRILGDTQLGSFSSNLTYEMKINTELNFGKMKSKVEEAVKKFNESDPKDGVRDICEFVEGATRDLASMAAQKQIINMKTEIIEKADWSNLINFLGPGKQGGFSSAYNEGSNIIDVIIKEDLKNDLHSFRGARNLVDHPVKSKQEENYRKRQYAGRMLEGQRLLHELLALQRRVSRM